MATVEHFRSIRKAKVFPFVHNVFLGPNNIGKTALVEALNLLLNPEIGTRSFTVDENDFYQRIYKRRLASTEPAAPSPNDQLHSESSAQPPLATPTQTSCDIDPDPVIRIEAVLSDLSEEDIPFFPGVLVPWSSASKEVVESSEEGVDPFVAAERAIRPCFEAWYDEEEDDFKWKTYFVADRDIPRDECRPFTREQKRRIGFLIYRDFRALQRPITLEPLNLFSRLLESQGATPKNYEQVLDELRGSFGPLFANENLTRVMTEFRDELLRYLPLSASGEATLGFEITDRTREELKAAAQLYVYDGMLLPIQKMGAGTRSLSLLAMLLVIARKRGRGIIVLEEPETFLFPHAQRRVIDEVLSLSSQTFVTTHSPYVLERMPIEGYQRLRRDADSYLHSEAIVKDTATARKIRERFKGQLSEALLGRGAIVVEEESCRLWLLKASALIHNRVFERATRMALEIEGIAVVTALGNGDVPGIVRLLTNSGIVSLGLLDKLPDNKKREISEANQDLPLAFLCVAGLEELLLGCLSKNTLRNLLVKCPFAKHNYTDAEIDSWDSEQFTSKTREYLRQHKGYLPFHEWLLDTVGLDEIPYALKAVVALSSELVHGTIEISHCTVLLKSPKPA